MSTVHDDGDTAEVSDAQRDHASSVDTYTLAAAHNATPGPQEYGALSRTLVLMWRLWFGAALATTLFMFALGMRIWCAVPLLLVLIIDRVVRRYARRQGITLPPPLGLQKPGPTRGVLWNIEVVAIYTAITTMMWFQDFTGQPVIDVGLVKHVTPDPDNDPSMLLYSIVPFIIVVGIITVFQWMNARDRERAKQQP